MRPMTPISLYALYQRHLRDYLRHVYVKPGYPGLAAPKPVNPGLEKTVRVWQPYLRSSRLLEDSLQVAVV